MPESLENLKLICGSANPSLGRQIADELGVTLCKSEAKRFSDGETSVLIEESLRGKDAFIIQSTCTPVNDNLWEFALYCDAARRVSARRVVAVVPYYGYSRQDRLI